MEVVEHDVMDSKFITNSIKLHSLQETIIEEVAS